MRAVVRIGVLCVALGLAAGAALGQPQVHRPTASPAAIIAGRPTQVVVSSLVSSGGAVVVPTGVNLLKVDQSGNAVATLGLLRDDGAAGDRLAGDGIFSGAFTFSEFSPGLVRIRVSAAFGGTLRRTLSEVATIEVLPSGTPLEMAPPDMTKVVSDSLSGRPLLCNEVLVFFRPGMPVATVQQVVGAVSGTIVGLLPGVELNAWQVGVPCNGSHGVRAALGVLSANPQVLGAEPNWVVAASDVVPNDDLFPQQTGLTRIQAPKAWEVSALGTARPESNPNARTIAVVDTGIDYNHPDLQGKVFLGRNWVNGDGDPMDDHGHGTRVAGIASAFTNNRRGISGTSSAQWLLAVKALDANNRGTSTTLAQGIADAVARQAHVINLSLGGAWSLVEAMAMHAANTAGRLVVAAAGNSNCSVREYPAGFNDVEWFPLLPWLLNTAVVAVGATNSVDDQRLVVGPAQCTPNSGSNFGSWVDLYAPGQEIISTDLGGGYTIDAKPSGTSMAAPFVAGVAALAWSLNPTLTAQQLRQLLVQSADDTGGRDPEGNPIRRLNAFRAVTQGLAFNQVCYTGLPAPVLAVTGTEDYEAGGQLWTRYLLRVTNKSAFPDSLFTIAPDLPPCGLNAYSARTWVDIFAQGGNRLYGFCALGSANDLNWLWFAVPRGQAPPDAVYITLTDRRCNRTYTSNLATVPRLQAFRLTNHPDRDAMPAWSANSNRIAFVSSRGGATGWGYVWAVNADGSDLRQVATTYNGEGGLVEPVWWSTTADLAVLEAWGIHEWFRLRLSLNPPLPLFAGVPGSYVNRLLFVEGGYGGGSFALTRDGTRAAWMILRTPWWACPTVAEVRTAPVAALIGQGAQSAGTVVASSTFSCAVPAGWHPFRRVSFSPDGSQLVLARNPEPDFAGYDLEIYGIDGRLVRRLTHSGGGPSPITNWNPVWSSDNRIAFGSNRTGRFEVYSIQPDGSNLTQVTYQGGDWPSWSPDNKRMAVQSERDGNSEIYILDVPQGSQGAYYSGKYPNLFGELLGKSDAEVRQKLRAAWSKLFVEPATRLYVPVGADRAYILDPNPELNHVTSEGISYGMMVAVQMDGLAEPGVRPAPKEVFDRLWRWGRATLQQTAGPNRGCLAWEWKSGGSVDPTPAPDGDEYAAMALLFASGRWGENTGIAYRAEAQAILDCVRQSEFEPARRLVLFKPGVAFTNPSYHLPAFYELWSRWARADQRSFWAEAAVVSRQFLRRTATWQGLTPDYAEFGGQGCPGEAGYHHHFSFDAWRVASNVGMDYTWFATDPWEVEQSNALLRFFHSQGLTIYYNQYSLTGQPCPAGIRTRSCWHSTGLMAMNAVAALAANHYVRRDFMDELWRASVPDDVDTRYYDGLLYLFGLLQVSGNFRIYVPAP